MHVRVVAETNDGSIHHLDWKRCQLDISAASNEDCTTVIDFLYTLASILFLGSFHCSLCINTSRHLCLVPRPLTIRRSIKLWRNGWCKIWEQPGKEAICMYMYCHMYCHMYCRDPNPSRSHTHMHIPLLSSIFFTYMYKRACTGDQWHMQPYPLVLRHQ